MCEVVRRSTQTQTSAQLLAHACSIWQVQDIKVCSSEVSVMAAYEQRVREVEHTNNDGGLVGQHRSRCQTASSVASGCSHVLCWLWKGAEKHSGLGASRSAWVWLCLWWYGSSDNAYSARGTFMRL